MARTRLPILVAIMVGVLVGLGVATFRYAEGLSYFSTDPAACTNCHIMQPQFDSWQKASHHTVATCVDCHLPHDFVDKYLAKASNGYFHSKGFTLQDFHEPIQITEGNAQILQANCVYCHERMIDDIVHAASATGEAPDCVRCHRDTGHGEYVGLGGPDRGYEKEMRSR